MGNEKSNGCIGNGGGGRLAIPVAVLLSFGPQLNLLQLSLCNHHYLVGAGEFPIKTASKHVAALSVH